MHVRLYMYYLKLGVCVCVHVVLEYYWKEIWQTIVFDLCHLAWNMVLAFGHAQFILSVYNANRWSTSNINFKIKQL